MIEQNREEFEKANILTWHKAELKGKGGVVVVLDSTHAPYEHTNVIDPFNDNIDKIGHKTHVAQLIREVAPECDIVVFSWFGGNKQGVVDWIRDHQSEVDVINCSFNSRVGTDIFEQLEQFDIPVIVSSGNDYDDEVGSGAGYPWTIAVGAWEEYRDNRARYSNYGEKLDLVAYTNIYITTEGTNNLMFNGTSCDAPAVSGMLAIYNGWLKENGLPKLTREEAKLFLMDHTVDKLEDGFDFESGHGLARLPEYVPEIISIPEIEEPIPEEVDEVFKDTKEHWAREYIDFVAEKGLMKGYEDGSFQPNKPISRAEVATIIARLEGYVKKQ